MSDEIFFDGERYISAGQAAASEDLSRDYVARLCREGKVRGRRIGKGWYVHEGSFTRFFDGQEDVKAERREKLAEERANEYREHQRATGDQVGSELAGDEFAAPMSQYLSHTISRTHEHLRTAAGVQGDRMIRFAPSIASAPGALHETIAKTAHSALHTPVHVITPLADFVQKFVALLVAFTMTFGTYALVDPAYARFAAASIQENITALRESYVRTTGGGAAQLARNVQSTALYAAENPAAALASAGSATMEFIPDTMRSLAKALNKGVNDFVYAVAFPRSLTDPYRSADGARVAVEIAPYARPVREIAPAPQTSSLVQSSSPTSAARVIERVERERVVERIVAEAGGITEEYLNQRLANLRSELYGSVSGGSSGGYTTITNNYQMIAHAQNIDNLGSVAITNSSFSGGTVSGTRIEDATITGSTFAGSVSATTLSASGASSLATTTVTGDLTVTGTMSGTVSSGSGTFGYITATSTTATSSVSTGGFAIGTTTPSSNSLFTVGTSSSLLYIDRVSGRIGVGTTSPASIFDIYGTDALRVPVGTTAQRPTASGTGQVRYNTTTGQFEGYGSNGVWQGLGGVIDADQDTYITADTNNADEDHLRFFTTGLERLTVTNSGKVGVGTTSPFAKFAVHAQNGETNTRLFEVASSTASATTSLFAILNNGQIGIGTASPNNSALLQLDSTERGFLPPRMTTAQKSAITSPSAGLVLFDSDLNKLNVFNGSAWKNVGSTEIGGEVTSGTQGSVLFIGDGTVLAQDNANFSFSTSSNRLLVTQASSTRLSVFGTAYFGGTATTTIDSAGNVAVAGTLNVTGNSTLANATSTNFFSTTASSTNLYSTTAQFGSLSVLGTLTQTGLGTFQNGFVSQASSTVVGNFTTTGTNTFGGALNITGAITSTASTANTLPYASSTAITNSGISYFGGQMNLTGSAANIALGSNFLSGDGGDEGIYVTADGIAGATGSIFTINGSPSNLTNAKYVRDAANALSFGICTDSTCGSLTQYLDLNDGSNNATLYGMVLLIDSDGTASTPAYSWTGDTDTGLFRATTDALGISTAGIERLRITSSGNVGIGTTSPTNRLEVAGNTFLGGNLTATGTLAITGATTLSSTLNVTGNTTLSNATTTNLFSTTASSTNLFAQTAQFGTLSVLGTLTQTGLGTFQNGFVSQASSTVVGAFTNTGAATFGSTLAASGLATLSSGYVSQASSTVVGAFTTTGAATFGSTLNVSGLSTLAGLRSTASSTIGDGTAGGGLTVSGTATTTNLRVTALTSGRIPYITTGSQFTDSANLTFDGSLLNITGNASSTRLSVFDRAYFGGTATTTIDSAGNVAVAGTLNVTGNTVLSNATTTNLFSTTASSTNLFAQTAQFGTLSVLGALTQTGLGTFANGFVSQASSTVVGNFTTTGTNTFGGVITSTASAANTLPYASSTAVSVSGTAYFDTASTSNLTLSGFAQNRIPYLGAAGAVTSSANLTFDGTTLTAANLTSSGNVSLGNATTTNLFSTTASSTNLFATTAQFGSLSVLGALTQTGLGTFANGFVSQASSTVVGAFTNTGAATFGSTLAASGLATLSSGYVSQASSTVVGNFTTTGTNTFGGALNITGAITSTASTANTLPYASSTAVSVSGTGYFGTASTTNLTVSGINSAVLVAGASGSVAAASTQTCTNQFIRSLSAAYVATCASVTNTDFANADWGDLSVSSNTVTIDADAVALGTDTTGNYLATLASSGSITVGNSGSESAAATVNLNMANANVWTALQSFANASSTLFSNTGTAYFGGTATTTIDSAGNVAVAGTLNVTGNTVLSNATTTNLFSTTASSTNLFAQTAQFGTLSVLGALTQTGLGTFANGFVSQASSTVVGAFTNTGAATFGSTLAASGLATLSSGFVSQASSTIVGAGTITGATTLGSTLNVSGLSTLAGLRSTASSTIGDGTAAGGLTVSGTATTTNLRVTALTSGRIPYITTGSQFTDSANLTFDGSLLALTGAQTISSTLGVTGASTFTGLGTFANGFVSQASSTVVGNFTTTGTNTFGGVITSTASTANTFPYASSTAISVSGTGYFGTASTTNLTVSGINSAVLVAGASGSVAAASTQTCTNQFIRSLSAAYVATCASVTNTDFANADWGDLSVSSNTVTIDADAVALGTDTTGNYLATLTSSGSITVGNSGSESAAATVNLNMASANVWTALQSFANASSTLFSNTGTAYFGGTATTTISSAGIITGASGAAHTFPYASSTALTVSGNSYFAGSGIWNSSGNVGIGTTSPGVIAGMSRYLTLSSTGSAEAVGFELVGNRSGADNAVARMSFVNNMSEYGRIGLQLGASGQTTDGVMTFSTADGGTLGERMRILGDGNVGIGTTTPASKLHVAGDNAALGSEQFYISGSTNSLKRLRLGYNTTDNYGVIQAVTFNSSFDNLALNPSGGNVGIGDTTPDHLLDVAGNIGVATSSYINWGDTDGTSGYGFRDNAGALEFKSSGGSWSPVGTISSTGSAGNPSFVFSSSTVGSNVSVNFNGAQGAAPSFSNGVLTLPSDTATMIVEVWGAGGGGQGGRDGTVGSSGGSSCFGTNSTACTSPMLSATGGEGGQSGAEGSDGGSGSGGDINLTGGPGVGLTASNATLNYAGGGAGGSAPRGGGGGKGSRYGSENATVGAAFGGGGGGGGQNAATTSYFPGTGGAGGGYSQEILGSPSGTYYYSIGAGGAGGAAGGAEGRAGAAGGAGGILITVYTRSDSNANGVASSSVAFSVHKNTTGQSVDSATWTKLTWSTETFDTNSNFASDKFTPTIAGKYVLTAQLRLGNIADGFNTHVAIYKNGSVLAENNQRAATAGADPMPFVSVVADANGTTDYFEVYARHNDTGAKTVSGESNYTFFTGALLAPAIATAGGWSNDGTTSYLTDSVDKVGVGTSSPWSKLAIQRNYGETMSSLFLVASSTASAGTNADSFFNVTSSGDVGIGTTTPGFKLATVGSAWFGGASLVYRSAAFTSNGLLTLRSGDNSLQSSLTIDNGGIGAAGNGNSILFRLGASGTLAPENAARIAALAENSTHTGATADGALTFSTAADGTLAEWMRITSAGNVGIGTTTPNSILEIYAAQPVSRLTWSSSANLGAQYFYENSTLRAGIQTIGSTYATAARQNDLELFTSSGDITFAPGNAGNTVEFKANGNVGIGTTSPSAKLHIYGDNSSVLMSRATDTSLLATNYKSAALADLGYIGFSRSDGTGLVTGGTANSLVLRSEADTFISSGATAVATFKSSGNVGIGTTTPDTALGVAGTIRAIRSAAPEQYVSLYASGGESYVESASGVRLNLRVGNTTALTAASGGNIGIGTTTPNYPLTVANSSGPQLSLGDGTNTSWAFRNSGGTLYVATSTYSATNTTPVLTVQSAGAVSINSASQVGSGRFGVRYPNGQWGIAVDDVAAVNGSAFIMFRSGTTQIGSVTNSANTAVAYNTTSDRRVKENIVGTEYGLDDLMQLSVHDFSFRSDPTETKTTGFIAQELYGIFPFAVSTNGDDGISPLNASSSPWGVDYGRVTPLIVKAIQDLNLKVEELSTTTPYVMLEDNSFAKRFFGAVIAWLGDAANGIGEVFADTFNASEKICIDGECLTADDVRALKDLAAAGAAAQGGSDTSGGGAASAEAPASQGGNEDTTPPVIEVQGANPATINVGDTYSDMGATVTDAGSPNIGIEARVDGGAWGEIESITIDTSTPGTHTVEYRATDQAGNVGTASRTVDVIDPNMNDIVSPSSASEQPPVDEPPAEEEPAQQPPTTEQPAEEPQE